MAQADIGLVGLAAFLGWRSEANRQAWMEAEALAERSRAAEAKANAAVIRAIDGESEAQRARPASPRRRARGWR